MTSKLLKVRDFMTKSPHSIESSASLDFARNQMKELGVRHLPILTKGKVVGVLSERSLNTALLLKGFESYTVADIMNPDPYLVESHTPLDEVVAIMAEEKYGSIIVMEEDKLVGIFTTIDVCRVLREFLYQRINS
jgi:acetoin utilization protein AcuB